MRRWVFIVLVACGGASPKPPEPIGNVGTPGPGAGAGSAAVADDVYPPLPYYGDGNGGIIYDADGDGVGDSADACPGVPEDYDDFAESDGCPDPDNDADGILDVDDQCPNEAEVRDGRHDDDGCPG